MIKITNRNFSAKIFLSSKDAIADLNSNSSLLVGGFGLSGIPENILRAIANKPDIKNLTVYSNNCGYGNYGLAKLVKQDQIKRMCLSFIGGNDDLERKYLKGEIELEMIPQGTLAEKLRAGGSGIPAFFTRTGYGTLVEKGGIPILISKDGKKVLIQSETKETRIINGKGYILEQSIKGDYALIKGWKADTKGNIIFRKTAQNLNPDCAKAAKITIAEVEEIVPAGSLDPDIIHLPGIFVNRLIKGEFYEKAIENKTIKENDNQSYYENTKKSEFQLKRQKISKRAALEIKSGMYVNLGIGIPTLVTNYVNEGIEVQFHSENGMLGSGEYPEIDKVDADLINASKETISETLGCSYFSSSDSFSIVRGSHISLTILGGMQVDENANLANWIIPKKLVRGMGGAMDLVSSDSKVLVCMEHTSKKGEPKIVKKCKLPITGINCVWKIITDLGVFEFNKEKELLLEEIFEDTTIDKVKYFTEADFKIAENLKTIKLL